MLPRYYDLLSVASDASPEEIAAARDELLAKYGSHAALGDRDAVRLVRAIEEAYATLADPARRAAYDASLVVVSLPPPSPPPLPAPPPATFPAPPREASRVVPAEPAPNPVALTPPPEANVSLAPPAAPAPAPARPTSRADLPSPFALLFFILDWMARQTIVMREKRARSGDIVPGESMALAAALPNGVAVGAAGWRFQIHDAFPAPSLIMNGTRLEPAGRWLLVRVAVRNDWPGHRALRAEDFALLGLSLSHEIALHPDATHAARLSLGMRGTPAGRYGLGFAALEEKETVLAFDLPDDLDNALLRIKPAAAIVDLAPVAPLLALGAPPLEPQILSGAAKTATLSAGAPRLEILSVNVLPGPGRYRSATVTARATPGMTCGIRVQYARGHSSARALAPTIVGEDGVVRWSWRVSPRTRPGDWPIIVTCGHNHAMATLSIGHSAN